MITAPIDTGPGRIVPGATDAGPPATGPAKAPELKPAVIGTEPVQANGPADRIDLSREATAKSAELQNTAQAQKAQKEDSGKPAPATLFTDRVREQVRAFEERASSVQFAIDKESGQVLIRIVNKSSGEMIRQIPPEEILDLQARLKDLRGLLLHEVT
jgi:flagellar protein FlaG